MTLIRRDALTVSPWRNGAGRKADIATGPGWLIGFAFLDADAPFSDYTGHDRTITLVQGPGFTLSGAGRDLAVPEPAQPAPFDGGWIVDCHIHGAPCVVLNAMTARADWRHSVTIHRGATPILADPGTAVADVLVVLRGEIRLNDTLAGAQDAFLLTAPASLQPSDAALVARISVHPA
jgi:hypothetical protein